MWNFDIIIWINIDAIVCDSYNAFHVLRLLKPHLNRNFKKVKPWIFAQELCLLPILFTLLNIKELNICCTYYHLFDFCVLHKVCLIRDKTGFWLLKSFKTAILFSCQTELHETQWILLVILLMDWKLFCKLKVHVFIGIKQMNLWCLVAFINPDLLIYPNACLTYCTLK